MKEDNKLIKEYLSGDIHSFEELFFRYKDKIFNFILSLVKDKELSQDLFQEVFIKVIDNLQKYNEGNFSAWIFLIARNSVYDYLKSKKNIEEKNILSIDDEIYENITIKDIIKDDKNPQDILIQENEIKKLYNAIHRLSYEYQEIIFLKHFSGMSFNEISKMLNIPMGTLLSRFKRAIDKLTDIMRNSL